MIDVTLKLHILHAICATLLGACFGSFAGVIIFRLQEGLSVVTPRSYCASCKKTLLIWHNLPIISWLLLRGRCGFCRASIGARTLIIEIMMAVGFLALFLQCGASIAFFERAAFLFLLICLAYIDLDTFYLPISLLTALLVVGCASSLIYFFKPLLFLMPQAKIEILNLMIINAPTRFSISDRVLGAVLGCSILVAINVIATLIMRKLGRISSAQWAMGFGDALMLGAIGIFVGASHLLLVIFLSSLLGSIVGISSRISKKAVSDEEIAEGALPYGPFLAIAAIYVYLF